MQFGADNWAEGNAYNDFMGRWSQLLAKRFLLWLKPALNQHWLDIGCGTGALSAAILASTNPQSVIGCDPSGPFIDYARGQIIDPRLSFQTAVLEGLPMIPGGFGVVVSGLVLNFVPEPVEAVRSMIRRCSPAGLVAAYVWDYAGRMEFLRIFWDAVILLDPDAVSHDEGQRFPLCQPENLKHIFIEAGLGNVTTGSIEIPTVFNNFHDYWEPFLGGTGAAPKYVASLESSQRDRLADYLKQYLDPKSDGKIKLKARAWAVRGELD